MYDQLEQIAERILEGVSAGVTRWLLDKVGTRHKESVESVTKEKDKERHKIAPTLDAE
jgi:hypothetical protein